MTALGEFRIGDRGPAESSPLAALEEERLRQAGPGETAFDRVLQAVRMRLLDAYTPAELAHAAARTRYEVLDLIYEELDRYEDRSHAERVPPLEGDRDQAAARLLNQILGMGALEPLIEDPTVEEIFINGTEVLTFGEGGYRPHPDVASQLTQEGMLDLINRLVAPQGRKVDLSSPILDARLPSGARVNVTMDPVAEPWPAVTIRVHRLVARTFEDLVQLGTFTPQLARFMEMVMGSYRSILVVGGTASGKTNLLNALASRLPALERVVVIEDTRELQLPGQNVIYLTVRQETVEGVRPITQRDLVANALRMRPRRIIMGEARDRAAYDAIKANNTGHEGGMMTVHADSAAEGLLRLEQLALEGYNLPISVLRGQIAKAFHYVLFIEQVPMATKRVVREVLELSGHVEAAHGEARIGHQLIFQPGPDGTPQWTGHWPKHKESFERHGYDFHEIATWQDGGQQAACSGKPVTGHLPSEAAAAMGSSLGESEWPAVGRRAQAATFPGKDGRGWRRR
jgi:pilus assembly protein CpaF